jgi:hypothetical protein
MPTRDKPLTRIARRHYFHERAGSWRLLLRKMVAHWLPERNLNRHLHGLAPFAGSGMWLVNRKTAQAMIDFLDGNPWYITAFRHTHCSDEMFFQTLAVHLGIEADGSCPTQSFWIKGRSNPEPIDAARLQKARNDWHFMARKFDRYYPD